MNSVLLLLAIVMAVDLAGIQDQSTVRLVTIGRKSGAPRPVPIWFVVDGGRIYVQAGKGGSTDWFRNLEKTPAVTLEFAERRLKGQAGVVEDAAEADRVRALFRRKYWLARIGSWIGIGFGAGRVVRIDVSE